MNKKNIKPIWVLALICIVVAALLAGVNYVTSPRIREREEAKANAALLVVLPGAKNFEKLTVTEDYPSGIKNAHKADLGYVFEVSSKGKENMTVMCGVDNNGALVKLDIITESETPGYKDGVFDIVKGDNGVYNGKTAENLAPELVSGATLTSNGVYNAVKAALDAYLVATGGEIAAPEEPEEPDTSYRREESEILALAAELVADSQGFTKMDIGTENESLVSVYREKSGKGYVAYVLVISENYGTVESEAVIYVGNNGKINGLKKLTWKTSDAIYGYVPPTEEAVDAFYGRLPGTTSLNIGEVELVTNATNTSTNVVNSFKEALVAVEELVKRDMATSEEQVIAYAKELVGSNAEFETIMPEDADYVRRIYKDKGGKGYVAYVVVISANYGTVESEAVIYVGNNGKINGLKKLTWKTSDAIYGYVPPTEEAVDAFYGRLPGTTSLNIGEVELVTNATNTSTNVVNSFKEALVEVEALIAKDMPTPEADILAYGNELMGGTAELENVTPDGTTYVKRIYKDKNGKGYIAYVVVISANYGTVESEAVIYVGNDGKIAGLKKLTWKTSDAIYGYVPPTQDLVDAFYGRLPGNDSDSLASVELVTNATNTSTNVVNSFKEALTEVKTLITKDMPTSEDKVLEYAKELVGEGAVFENVTPEGLTYVRRIYREEGGRSYVAYVVVISANYGTVESEALIHIDNKGEIKNIKRLTWKTSDAIYGYVPPTEDVVNAFYGRLPGNDAESIEKVELVTNATNTSTHVVNSFKEALVAVDKLIVENNDVDKTPRIVGIVILVAAVLGAVAATVVSRKVRGGRKI